MASATEQDTEVGDSKSESFLDQLESCFGSSDLYEVIQISDRKCDFAALRKAYHKLSIKVHPDRVKLEERGEATHRFQLLGRVYQTLKDPARRSEYDQFGVIQMEDDTNCPDGADSWEEYWRLIHPKILLDEVAKFSAEYRDSGSELSDLKQIYESSKGDMDTILESMMCSVYTDDERFRSILTPLIEAGELPSYDKFTKESKKRREKRKKKGLRESEEAKQLQEELGINLDSEESLVAKIRSRGQDRFDSYLNNLEEKYSTEKDAKKVKVDKKQTKSKRGAKK